MLISTIHYNWITFTAERSGQRVCRRRRRTSSVRQWPTNFYSLFVNLDEEERAVCLLAKFRARERAGKRAVWCDTTSRHRATNFSYLAQERSWNSWEFRVSRWNAVVLSISTRFNVRGTKWPRVRSRPLINPVRMDCSTSIINLQPRYE